ncbi:MAG TPA: PilZ domain-containing protein [Candidatus Omnitrophota bacterium]|nr:PilZ domain-containing protein [Candidatus Omnitrophota bacterium]
MIEKRQYVRMNTVFPVEFEIVGENGNERLPHAVQGFTRDVSAGGMCIEFKSFGKDGEKLTFHQETYLALVINPTFSRHPIRANARVAWLRKEDSHHHPKYLIGVAYTQIEEKARQRLIRYAKRLIWIPRITAAVLAIALLFSIGLFYRNQELQSRNKALVQQLVDNAERKSSVTTDMFDLQKKRELLEKELAASQKSIEDLEASLAALSAENWNQRTSYEDKLKSAQDLQKTIGGELATLKEDRERLRRTFQSIEQTDKLTASAALRQMYGWLKSHQNLNTGLVASFEGDKAIEDWSFTYDQSLVCQTFLLFGDTQNAKMILEFFDKKAEQESGAFFNTYDATRGHAVESIVHVGPNVWLGMAALQYEHRMKDGQFLPLAKRVATWLMRSQDAEGGLKGGPTVDWYSTEHNLDAYAFFRMLHEETGDAQYKRAADRVLGWLKKYAYSMKEKRMNRGKGDATIATDTFSWAIAAIGPAKLKEIEFDPEAIMEFAEEHCEVTVQYKQPSGKMAKARGFDFAKGQNLGRGGVISTEWTAQVIVTYQVLARYFVSIGDPDKGAVYLDKANFYLNELQKLIITSPSRTGQGRGCLPYASTDNVDTGHGWRTPSGRRTGSVAGTAYGIFAWTAYNPFNLDNKKVS